MRNCYYITLKAFNSEQNIRDSLYLSLHVEYFALTESVKRKTISTLSTRLPGCRKNFEDGIFSDPYLHDKRS